LSAATPTQPDPYLAVVIKLRRLKAGLTQEELALEIGVKPSEISHLEAGRRNPKVGTVKRVAKGLDVPAWQIMEQAERLEAWIEST
jgi:transcriptional regulator with XRE-family HTH domain